MNSAMTYESHANAAVSPSASAPATRAPASHENPDIPRAVSSTPRILLRLEGGAALAFATSAYGLLGGHWLLFAILFLAPDLAMLGYLAGAKIGAASYNAVHSYLAPALLAAIGLVAHGLPATPSTLSAHSTAALLVACIWAAHIGFDRLLGYGLKYATGFGDTHLGLPSSRGARLPR